MAEQHVAENEEPIDDRSADKPESLESKRGESPSTAADTATDLAHLETELEQANSRALRAQAELENFRKRARREMEDERRYASLPLLSDLLGVLDNLQRAVEAAEKTHNAADLLAGVKMVSQQLLGVLQQHECQPIKAGGSTFDPHLHEAIGQEPSADQPSGVVTRVAQTGYLLHGRVVRPAQVMISSGPAEEQPGKSQGPQADAAGDADDAA